MAQQPKPSQQIPQVLIDALDRLNTETNNIAAVVQSLRDRISTAMTQEDVDAVQNTIDAVVNRLQGIAADPNQPIPVDPPPAALRRR